MHVRTQKDLEPLWSNIAKTIAAASNTSGGAPSLSSSSSTQSSSSSCLSPPEKYRAQWMFTLSSLVSRLVLVHWLATHTLISKDEAEKALYGR